MDKKLCDVCRLCLSKDNLVWIFDKRLESSENMKDVIYITTGVEIHMKDLISQKICKQCCEVTIKMFEFRRKSLANDRILREQSKKYLKKIVKRPTDDITNQSSVKSSLTVDPGMKAEAQNPEQESCLVFKVHPTVRDLFKLYPQIKLPTACLKAHITPFVSMPVHQVENYFKERKMDMNRHIQLVSTSKKCKTNITPTSATGDASEYSEITQGASDNNQNGIYSSKNIVPTNPCHEIQATKNTENAHENTTSDKKNSENLIRQESHRDKKRKFVETEAAPKNRCIKKPMIVKSVVSTSDISTISLPLTQSVESSPYVSKYICDICNSVENSAKALKRHHRVIHLTCHLCTTRFPSIESKQNHIKNICIIKKRILNNLPYIEVEKN
ncbi:hypothetical protein NQ318_022597 [Aromia moschata]|uniref:ZAD domain-containing protein n=1 Tax=Aromia moschata TaxID=1265417 RepID=A0AAV8XVW2_9CUCU|nr:hypothetical protein NQ318_022597 [Aromia moschata]